MNENEPAQSARANLAPTMGNTATGTVTFTPSGSNIKLTVTVANAPPATEHGFHLHVNPACGPDGMEAGGHWDPTTMMHGKCRMCSTPRRSWSSRSKKPRLTK